MRGPAGIPLWVEASTAVARRLHFEGAIPIARLARLKQALASTDGTLNVALDAATDAAGHAVLHGGVSGKLPLVCQRCLKPFDWALDLRLDLRLVNSAAEEARVLRECDPYRVGDDRLSLHELVEDEVLLALPMAPRCGDPACAMG